MSSKKISLIKSLDISYFTLEQAVIQLTYPLSLILWDRSGELWTQVQEKWPDIVMKKAEPNNTNFKLRDKYEFSVEVDKTRVIGVSPQRTLKDFIITAESFLNICIDTLELNIFNRIGFRAIFFKEFSNIQGASAALLKSKLLNLHYDKLFSIEGSTSYPDLAFRWENNLMGTRTNIKAEKRILNIDSSGIPWPDIKPISKERFGVVYDVDRYTLVPVPLEQLKISEWIIQALSTIKSEANKILGP